jgi:hypothetical protein
MERYTQPHLSTLTLSVLQTATITLKPGAQVVRAPGTASLTAKIIGADGRPVQNKQVTFATGADLVAATTKLGTSQLTATTDATGLATRSIPMANAGRFVAVASMGTGNARVVSAAAYIVVKA